MNKQTGFNDIDALEKELAELAPIVRQGFERAGMPSPHVEDAIRAEARRALAGRARAVWPRYQMLAAAAALALLLGGSVHLFVSHTPAKTAAVAAPSKAQADESAAGFANLLLEIQGLNEDSFFRTEEAESLWL
jgi:hypothetical protein